MKLIKETGYSYKGFQLGQEVIVKDKKCKIIAFDTSERSEDFIAVNQFLNYGLGEKYQNISESGCRKGVYIVEEKDEYNWITPNMIEKDIVTNTHSEVKSPFKVGQRVWDCSRGYGTVIRIIDDEDAKYPVVVLFDDKLDNNDTMYFTLDGRQYKRYNRTLFFEEILIPESALKPKRWRAKKGCKYFFISTQGSIEKTHEDNFKIDNERYESGNYFRTEADAEDSIIYKAFQQLKEKI